MLSKEKNEKKPGSNKLLKGVLELAHKYFLFVALIVFAVIIIIGYIFLIQPKYVAVSDKVKADEEQKTKELDNLTSYSDRLLKYRNEYNGISVDDKERINGLIAGNYVPESVFAEMEKLIFSRGLILNSIDVSSQAKTSGADGGGQGSGVGETTIKLDITGVNYEGLKQLLAIMESNLRLLDVKKVSFSPGDNAAQLEIVSYYINQ
jgi:hypothetical protein